MITPMMEKDPAYRHSNQHQPRDGQRQPREHPPSAALRGQNTPFGLETVDLPQYSGQQQKETYAKQ
jgi:hypothetical protein